jgi:hypothetical protein
MGTWEAHPEKGADVTNRLSVFPSCAAAFVYLLVAAPAPAQTAAAYQTAVGASYDLVYHQVDSTSNAGFHVDLSRALAAKADTSIVGEIGVNHFFRGTASSFLGGGRMKVSGRPKYQPFVQVLLGIYHSAGGTNFAIQPGAGADFMPKGRAFRLRVQVDLRHVFVSDVEDFNPFRLSGGIVLGLGK